MECIHLLHPFQHDPGTSQHQRVLDDLLSSTTQIDGRQLSDLLDYFVQLSRHVNYYDAQGDVLINAGDWQAFFRNSTPFTLSAINKYNLPGKKEKLDGYYYLFGKKPSARGLQLLLQYTWYYTISRVDTWYQQVKDNGLTLEPLLLHVIKDKLHNSLVEFIALDNAAASLFAIKRIDFRPYYESDYWDLEIDDLYGVSSLTSITDIAAAVVNVFNSCEQVIDSISTAAAADIENSLLPLKAALQQQHTPHLGLLFAFLKLFHYLQDDLNSFAKKHLDFFYQQVLQLKPRPAQPDQVHILVDIQQQLEQYRLQAGLLVKDGKDNNKAEVLFSLDNELVANKAQVADVRTLFVSNGVYMAPNALFADGVSKGTPDSWPTMGSHFSKYIDPEQKFTYPYPHARLGFILASPVLLLNEGKRTITIKLACTLTDATDLYSTVAGLIQQTYYYISKPLIGQAVKRGISSALEASLFTFLLEKPTQTLCYNPQLKYNYDALITKAEFDSLNTGDTLKDIFPPQKALNVSFSGKDKWLDADDLSITLDPALNGDQFSITINAILQPASPAIAFYDKDKLKEDFNTTQPVVKVLLNDLIAMRLPGSKQSENNCCLSVPPTTDDVEVSLYYFFKHVILKDNNIDVTVCGLKNFIVQNDDSPMDINGIIYPFSSRPRLGSHFILSSKEIFNKNWTAINLRLNWKDKPASLETYYHGYEDLTTTPIINTADFNENNFLFSADFLDHGSWRAYNASKKLFSSDTPGDKFCGNDGPLYFFNFKRSNFTGVNAYKRNDDLSYTDAVYTNAAQDGFLRLTLASAKNLDFQHSRYSYVLTRQMLALGKYPEIYVGPVYDGISPSGTSTAQVLTFDEVFDAVKHSYELTTNIRNRADQLIDKLWTKYPDTPNTPIDFSDGEYKLALGDPPPAGKLPFPPAAFPLYPNGVPDNAPLWDGYNLKRMIDYEEDQILKPTYDKIVKLQNIRVVIPNEPYTPQIKGISLDYTATATIKDIDLIHLHPYTGTYQPVSNTSSPTLFPLFTDEGNLFIGLKDLQPGNNLSVLFQLAEATADSEAERQTVQWYYLDNNQWKPLRTGFEVLDDATDGLTTSGIIQFSLPANMTNENTILPSGLHWIKAAIPFNSRSVAETIGIHTQAVRVTFTNDAANDKMRLATPLDGNQISKLKDADAKVKKISQPYPSFGGSVPEEQGQYYVRVSELLRHKGRAIQKFDYERIVLDAFPQVFKVKCINHSHALDAAAFTNDFPMAPGHVLVAVIPDLNKLKASQAFEPKAPLSLLEKIQESLQKVSSPFVKLKVMNPRYEKVNACIQVKLYPGKDKGYYKDKLAADLREFLAPWAVGVYDKLSFGQCIYRSDIVYFLETRDYVDYVQDLRLWHAGDPNGTDVTNVCPITPRSILIAGDVEVNIPDDEDENWDREFTCGNQPTPVMQYCEDSVTPK
ncbi:MAG: hypothetical protein H6Q26_165 [Bacteroidetes bacterium]|nr:hypothetical protein [Bacteroidota bacterium]